MLDRELCESVFEIEPPWHITRLNIDARRRRIDIWIANGVKQKKTGNWFKRSILSTSRSESAVWQHLSVGDCRTYIHAHLDKTCSMPWLGDAAMPFTHALSRRVVELLSERVSYRATCSFLNVELQDVWMVKRALDRGDIQLGESVSPTHLERKADLHQEPAPTTSNTIPPIEDPVWLRVINNDIEIQIRQLGLKLLISRVRSQFSNANDDETRLLRMNELRKYFLKHERFLQHELKQMIA